MECIVCCNNLTTRPIQCRECDYKTCETCVETYLMDITNDPHCMNCRCIWDILFLRQHLRADFLDGNFRQRRMEILSHRSYRQEDPDMLCSCPSCANGKVIKTTFACLSCWVEICPKCLCVRGASHECREEIVSSLQRIRQSTRPCPGCHAPIEKQSGCFQMFCTHCFTAFDWNNGSVLDKVHLHNPHYTEHKSTIDHLQETITTITDRKMKIAFQNFHRLVLDIGHQMVVSSRDRPVHQSSTCDLYMEDQYRLYNACIHDMWSNYYKRGLRIIRDKLYHQMAIFQKELKDALLEYNEHVNQCLQLRGHRLFPSSNPSLFCF